jgi:hypothetical protein
VHIDYGFGIFSWRKAGVGRFVLDGVVKVKYRK